MTRSLFDCCVRYALIAALSNPAPCEAAPFGSRAGRGTPIVVTADRNDASQDERSGGWSLPGRQRLLGKHQDIERLPRLGHVSDAGRQISVALARMP